MQTMLLIVVFGKLCSSALSRHEVPEYPSAERLVPQLAWTTRWRTSSSRLSSSSGDEAACSRSARSRSRSTRRTTSTSFGMPGSRRRCRSGWRRLCSRWTSSVRPPSPATCLLSERLTLLEPNRRCVLPACAHPLRVPDSAASPVRRGSVGGINGARVEAAPRPAASADPVHLGAQGELDRCQRGDVAQPVLAHCCSAWIAQRRAGSSVVRLSPIR